MYTWGRMRPPEPGRDDGCLEQVLRGLRKSCVCLCHSGPLSSPSRNLVHPGDGWMSFVNLGVCLSYNPLLSLSLPSLFQLCVHVVCPGFVTTIASMLCHYPNLIFGLTQVKLLFRLTSQHIHHTSPSISRPLRSIHITYFK